SSFFFSSRRRHTRSKRDWSSDVCSSDLPIRPATALIHLPLTARPQLIRRGRLRRDDDGPIRIRPAFWEELLPGIVRTAPSPLLQADLLLEDDPRIDEIRKELFKSRH